MSNYVREIGTVEDIEGNRIPVGADHDAVRIGVHVFPLGELEDLLTLMDKAVEAAAENKQHLDEEAADDAADALDGVDAGFPMVPAAQIAAEAAADMRRLANGG